MLCRSPLPKRTSSIELAGLSGLWEGPFEDVHSLTFLRGLAAEHSLKAATIESADPMEFADTRAVPEWIEQQIGIPVDHITLTASHDHNALGVGKVTPRAVAGTRSPWSARRKPSPSRGPLRSARGRRTMITTVQFAKQTR